ncbi:hypothetical protein GCM10011514_41780 [Emticicia aquatilis]|uniref:Polymerase/histidinol phosphatase N-terminal domain-containing protein n=1 Tax=Emticicia aquatilis TaxID=1537369 RepID=A0A916Z3W9_9BACT|nr:PHP domain-containing protein [Emticicia aquatilis]GGD73369.1 hypothetical protein GCM10011514_41780 [Emticicia aquatilis]
MSSAFVGTRWYKCDLHLHTPASLCFKNHNNVTPEQWVQEALDKGLNCVAVTDHNTAEWVDKIKDASKNTTLTVFPGVEITCSDAKVHLLILFDVEYGKQKVEDFLVKAKIERKDFGQQTAHTNMNLEDVVNLASSEGALIIPAHIDEFNGLCEPGSEIIKSFYKLKAINSVQVVHEKFTLPTAGKIYDDQKLNFLIELNQYYGLTEKQIAEKKWKFTDERMKNARRVVTEAINANKAILTFSDNPYDKGDSSHGLWGIGTRHTWIKMEEKPSLESLRQALLLPKLRIRNDFEGSPRQFPNLWIQKIIIRDTEISKTGVDLCVDFSPQMNTIIGGRGSGKSSILQFIRGVFKRSDELKSLDNIHADFVKFFQLKQKGKNKSGVLKENTVIEIHISRGGINYAVSFQNKTITVSQFNEETQLFELKQNPEILDRLEFDIFSQKQIYEIATTPNSLRTRIDKSEPAILEIERELEVIQQTYTDESKKVRDLISKIANKNTILLDIEDLERKIKQFKTSGADTLLKDLQSFEEEKRFINVYKNSIESKVVKFEDLILNLSSTEIDNSLIRTEHQDEFNGLFSNTSNRIKAVKTKLEELKDEYVTLLTNLQKQFEISQWQESFNTANETFKITKEHLTVQGIDLEGIEKDISLLSQKKQELDIINNYEKELTILVGKKESTKRLYFDSRKKLQQKRQKFLDTILNGRNVRAKVLLCKDYESYSEEIRRIFNLDEQNFANDVKNIVEKWEGTNPNKILEKNQEIFDFLFQHFQNKTNDGSFNKLFFTNKLHNLNDESIDQLDLLFPEDEIQIEYKLGNTYKPISNGSAGQKTAAILTLLLSHGTKPLILDQPEDDLDNRLIYDLVVDQMRHSKEFRQIIVVTHNANIPVNGDSEHIIVMDSETKHIQVKLTGSVEKGDIKEEICNVMEGGIDAFSMRSKRYGALFT